MPHVIHRCAAGDTRFELVDPENYPIDLPQSFDNGFILTDSYDEFPHLGAAAASASNSMQRKRRS